MTIIADITPEDLGVLPEQVLSLVVAGGLEPSQLTDRHPAAWVAIGNEANGRQMLGALGTA